MKNLTPVLLLLSGLLCSSSAFAKAKSQKPTAKSKIVLDCIVSSVEDSSYFEESLSTIQNPSVTLSKANNRFSLKIGDVLLTSKNEISVEGDQDEGIDGESKLWSTVRFTIDNKPYQLQASATQQVRQAKLITYDETNGGSDLVIANLVCRGGHLDL